MIANPPPPTTNKLLTVLCKPWQQCTLFKEQYTITRGRSSCHGHLIRQYIAHSSSVTSALVFYSIKPDHASLNRCGSPMSLSYYSSGWMDTVWWVWFDNASCTVLALPLNSYFTALKLDHACSKPLWITHIIHRGGYIVMRLIRQYFVHCSSFTSALVFYRIKPYHALSYE